MRFSQIFTSHSHKTGKLWRRKNKMDEPFGFFEMAQQYHSGKTVELYYFKCVRLDWIQDIGDKK